MRADRVPCKTVLTVLTFVQSCENVDELNDSVTDYIDFCVDIQTREKHILYYPSNKPWITKDLNKIINEQNSYLPKGIEWPSN